MFDVKKLKLKKLEPVIQQRGGSFLEHNKVRLTILKTNETKYGTIKEIVIWLQKKGFKRAMPSIIFGIAANTKVSQKFDVSFVKQADKEKFDIFKCEKARTIFIQKHPKYNRKIVAYDLNGNQIQGFHNTIEIMLWLDRPIEHWYVINECKNKNQSKAKSVYGYQWKFLSDVLIQ